MTRRPPSRPRRRSWFRNQRVSRKLAIVIAVHLLHAVVLLGVTAVGMEALSASRAYVEGEGHWSKAQKSAALHLILYSETGDEDHYRHYLDDVNVTLGDRQARLELEKRSPDMALVHSGFVQGLNHPDDIDGMAWLFRTFRSEPHIDEAIRLWAEGDALIETLTASADELHAEISADDPDAARIDRIVDRILEIDAELTVVETRFSNTLGDGARWLMQVVVLGTLGLTIVFVGVAVLVSASMTRQLARSLRALEAGAARLADGDLGRQIEEVEGDDVGRVAEAFNVMSRRLATAVAENARREGAVAKSLREKEAMLKEIHHRVKNNLQVTSGLLYLQSRHVQEETTKELFLESMNRIKSMALVHEKLYEAKDLAGVDFADYAEGLIKGLMRAYRRPDAPVTVKTDIAHVALDIDTSVNLGLMLNELLSNALKHAFPAGRPGRIWIGLGYEGPGRLSIRLRDNGIGLPPGFDIDEARTMGLQLVAGIARHLDGVLTMRSDRGTEVHLGFPAAGRVVRMGEAIPAQAR